MLKRVIVLKLHFRMKNTMSRRNVKKIKLMIKILCKKFNTNQYCIRPIKTVLPINYLCSYRIKNFFFIIYTCLHIYI